MKKRYEYPALEMIALLNSDVLTLSEGDAMGDGEINSVIFGNKGNADFGSFN